VRASAVRRRWRRPGTRRGSRRYAHLLTQKQAMADAHAAQRLAAAVQEHVQVRRLTPRSGPLGRDAQGHEYWQLLPVVHPGELGAAVPGVHAPFSGHWSHALVVRCAGEDVWRATTSADDVAALVQWLEGRGRADAALVARLAHVRDYLAWLPTARACSPGTPAPP